MSDETATCFGLVLAGGKSSRMGQDKACLQWDGMTLLERQFSLLEKALGQNRVFVSGTRRGYPSIPDEMPNRGPLEGIRSAFQTLSVTCKNEWSVLVVPVDMPLLREADLVDLFSCRGDGDVITFQGHTLPALIRCDQFFYDTLEVCLRSPSKRERSLQFVFSKLRWRQLQRENCEHLRNLNTREDWNAALSATDFTE